MADETAVKPPKAKKARKPRPEATSEELEDRRLRAEWTRDKFSMLQAALHDPRMKGNPTCFFIYILQCTNYRSRVAVVHDQQIMDELVPGFGDDETIRRTRNKIIALGWFGTNPGRGSRATIYTPRADNVEAVMSLIRIKAEDRRQNHAYRREAARAGKETLQQQHQITNEMRGKRIKRSPQNAGETTCQNEGITPSLTPSASQGATGRSQDVELRPAAVTPQAEVMSCHVCGVVAEAGITASGRCAECESDALRIELLDRELPRSQSGEFMCIDCGTDTRLAARYTSEPFNPHCPNCIEASAFLDVKPIAGQPSYAEASRGG